MYPYLKELTLDEALQLPNSDKNVKAYFPDYDGIIQNPSPVKNWIIENIYSNGKSLFITALDYATHILKQAAPPEGYGYAAYDLDSGRYYGLEFGVYYGEGWDVTTNPHVKFHSSLYYDWQQLCFRLTDLARVEGTDTDKTEINAAQVIWMYKNYAKTIHWQNGTEWECFGSEDLENSITDKYELLTSTYNALPQEFKDLAAPIPPSGIRPPLNCCPKCDETHQELTAKVANWEAKYKELEAENKELKEKSLGILGHVATNHIADQKMLNDRIAELEDRLKDAQNCIAAQEKENQELTIKCNKLSQYAINNLLNNL